MSTLPVSRGKRLLRGVWAVLGTGLVFVASMIASLLLHADCDASRRLVATEVSRVLGGVLAGRVELELIGRVGLLGLDGVRARVFEPGGRQVLYVDGLRVRFSVLGLVKSLLGEGEALRIALDDVDIAYVEVELDGDAEGEMRIARAFSPRPEGGEGQSGGRAVVFSARTITVAHAWAHGTPPGAVFVDADVDRVQASVDVSEGSVLVRVEGLELEARGLPRSANPRGHVSGSVRVPLSVDRIVVRLAFSGEVGGIAAQAWASLDGDTLDAAVEVPHATARDVRALIPEAPIHADGAAIVAVHGTLPALDAELHATLGRGALDASLRARFDAPLRGSVEARVRELDVRVFAPNAPASRLNAEVRASARRGAKGDVEGVFELSMGPGELGGEALPAAHVRGRLERGTLSGQASLDEPGLPARATFALTAVPEPRTLSFTLDAKAPELSRVRRFDLGLRGEARVHVAGTVDLVAGTVDARTEAGLAHVRVPGGGAERGFVWADVRGSLADPGLVARVELEGVDAGGARVERLRAAVDGCVHSVRLTASARGAETPDLDLETRLDTTPALLLLGTRLTAARGDVVAHATLGSVRIAPTLRLEEGSLTGLGEPAAFALDVGPEGLTLRARAAGLELSRLATLVGAGACVTAGTLALDADVTLSAGDGRGHVGVDLTGVVLDGAPGLELHAAAQMQGERLSVQARAALGAAGHAALDASDVRVRGDRRMASSWQGAEGRVGLDAELELAGLTALLPAELRLLGDAGGRVLVEGSLSRGPQQGLPDLELTLRTVGLSFSGPTPEVRRSGAVAVLAAPPWRILGVDGEQRVEVRGDSGETTVRARLVDESDAPLLTLEASAIVPYRALVEHPERARSQLERVPLSLHCVAPRRRLGQLPELLRPEGLRGEAELSFEAEGTLLAPRAKLVVRGDRLRWAEGTTAPSAAELVVAYAGDVLEGKATLASAKGALLTASGEAVVRMSDVLRAEALAEVPWVASLRAILADFPLEMLPPLRDAHLAGLVTGEVSVSDLHHDARASAHLALRAMSVDELAIPSGELHASYDGQHAKASFQLTQVDGAVAAHAAFGARWGAALWPALDEAEPFEASLAARRFRLAAVAPLVESVASALDGRLDADARVSIPPAGAGPRRVTASGSLSIDEGHVQWARVGDELSNVRLRVELEPTGVLKLRSLTARSVTGSLSATGEARFDGLRFASAAVAVRVPESQPIPISVEGQLLAEASGRVDITAVSLEHGRVLSVEAHVPVLRARLPDREAHTIQPLEPDPHVLVGRYRNPRELVLIPLSPPEPDDAPSDEPTEVVVTVHLGDDVELRRGSELRVRLGGTQKIVVADETRVRGQIQLLGGKLDVQGRSFTIDRGTVTFVGDAPDDPEIVASATWEAPEGALVYASYAGTASSGRLTLRSDPPLPEGEILALLLFGSADGPGAAPPSEQASDGTARAVGLGGAFATAGLNRAMQDLTGLDVEAKIDTTNASNPRPEIAVQLTQRLSIAVAHVLGAPPPGESPDKSFVKLEWRMLRNWSLESTFGDRGSAVFDVVWKYRY